VADRTIWLYNAQPTSGGTGPGQVTVDESEAAPLIAAGYAVGVAAS